jgi:hypothetical protein
MEHWNCSFLTLVRHVVRHLLTPSRDVWYPSCRVFQIRPSAAYFSFTRQDYKCLGLQMGI